ncbi:hypothetical protein Sinac_5193 [Singulisphaera acidiphila DSM 18658]|uniref:Uncharacterized protein n=1 Tax=Singulisphaera acidiphila (strain ATCC BAA-1392 / DSM 18658 / VKM B-2454 / MOB10) TaxID=886293 RepID=L0DKI2_SINAD|nr:hypothetical protein Sinac_5193 [Singulisphaera acidiphila DSM 18658]
MVIVFDAGVDSPSNRHAFNYRGQTICGVLHAFLAHDLEPLGPFRFGSDRSVDLLYEGICEWLGCEIVASGSEEFRLVS